MAWTARAGAKATLTSGAAVIGEVGAFIATVALPPNLRLHASESWAGSVLLTIEADWWRLDDPSVKVTTARQMVLMPGSHSASPELLRAQIQSLVSSMWMHELDEWFKIGGEYVREPHANRAML